MLALRIIPCLKDNYAYLLDDGRGDLMVVDPSEGEPIRRVVEELGGRLTAILATHHHHDHVGGIAELCEAYPGVRVYGFAEPRPRIPRQTDYLTHGQSFAWGELSVRTLHVPGHTLGAVAYAVEDALFTGDTLFTGGCGRLFEGTPEMMYRSLNEVLSSLDPSMRIYCGHEYTAANLLFAIAVEPTNGSVADELARVRELRSRGETTMGTTLGRERTYNPFLRCDRPAIRTSLRLDPGATDVATFTALRAAKDVFRAP